MHTITFFGKTNFRNQERIFGIKRDDRRRHMYVIGKTGMGKTNLLENMAIQDIRNGEGMCYIDPHGDSAEKLLKAVPSHRINDVIYFNPSDSEHPVAFNILEAVDESKKNLVASGMMGVFKKLWPDVWSARMEYILNNSILALLDYPGSTMMGVNRMMSDGDFRKRVYPLIKDPVVKSFWLNEFDKWDDKFRKEAVSAIQNKVGQFLSSSLIRHIVGQPKSTIDMREIMDNRKILIVNLSKGKIGEDAMRLLGGMIVTKIQLAAMGRVDMPEDERKDFYLHVDEFQNFVTESFANILSEARKYHLNLTLAHQYINQLVFDGNTTVRDAVFGNVGTMITFRVGAEDAEFLEKEFDPIFLMNDLVNLTKYNVYLKLMIDGVAGDAFSATTLPPVDLSDTEDNEEKVIKISRERYSGNRAEVEEKIERWSGMMINKSGANAATAPPLAGQTVQPAQVARSVASKPQSPPIKIVLPTKVAPPIIVVAPPIKIVTPTVVEKEASAPEKPVVKKVELEAEVKNIATDLPMEPPLVEQVPVESAVEKPMFATTCSTCEQEITVPFKPDPKRPAFCKECLKDYQRMMARSRAETAPVSAPSATVVVPAPPRRREEKQQAPEIVSYAPQERAMSLLQMSHIAPKKFKASKKRPQVDLGEVRKLIDESQDKN